MKGNSAETAASRDLRITKFLLLNAVSVAGCPVIPIIFPISVRNAEIVLKNKERLIEFLNCNEICNFFKKSDKSKKSALPYRNLM